MAGLLIGAVALRAPGLDPSSLWLDDTWVALVHKVDELPVVLRMGVTAPGFSLLLKALFSIFGFSHFAAQAIPFLAGVAAPPLVYLIARRWGAGRWAATLGAALLLLAPVHVTYSTNVKQFTVDVILGLALLHLSWRTFDAPDQDRLRRLALIAAVATLFSASVGPVAAVAVAVPALPRLLDRQWRSALWPGAYGLYALTWALVLRSRLPTSLGTYWERTTSSGITDPFRALGRFASEFGGGPWVGGAVLVVLGAAVLVLSVRERLLLVGPVLVAALASFVGIPLGTGRTDMYLYGGMAIAVALVVDRLVPRPVPQAVVLAAVVAALAVPLPRPGYADPEAGMTEDVRPLVHLATTELGPDDELITVGSRFAVALYGPWTVSIHEAPNSTTGWLPAIEDDRILPTAGWPHTPADLRATFPEPTADRVQVLVSHFDRSLASAAFQVMIEAGYVQTEQRARTGAWWAQFERDGLAARLDPDAQAGAREMRKRTDYHAP